MPMPKLFPESAVDVTVRVEAAFGGSSAVGSVQVTTAVEAPAAAATIMSFGQEVRVGAAVSLRPALITKRIEKDAEEKKQCPITLGKH